MIHILLLIITTIRRSLLLIVFLWWLVLAVFRMLSSLFLMLCFCIFVEGLADGDEQPEKLLGAIEEPLVLFQAVVHVDDAGAREELHHLGGLCIYTVCIYIYIYICIYIYIYIFCLYILYIHIYLYTCTSGCYPDAHWRPRLWRLWYSWGPHKPPPPRPRKCIDIY